VGYRIGDVPVQAGATPEEALGGGEDYELVMVTADGKRLLEAFAGAGLRPPIAIGTCVADPSEQTLDGGFAHEAGWEHPFTGLD
jgi:thiamine-monophosphate kinase